MEDAVGSVSSGMCVPSLKASQSSWEHATVFDFFLLINNVFPLCLHGGTYEMLDLPCCLDDCHESGSQWLCKA